MLELINQRRAAPEDLPGVQGGPFEAELPGRQASAHQAGPCVDCLLSTRFPSSPAGCSKAVGSARRLHADSRAVEGECGANADREVGLHGVREGDNRSGVHARRQARGRRGHDEVDLI